MKTRFLIIVSWVMLGLFFALAHGADCEKAKRSFNEAYSLDNDIPGLIRKEQLYKNATDLCPSMAEAHNNLGDIYEREGRFEEAIEQYKKTIELIPVAAYPYFGLGDIYYKTNRPKEAADWYEKGLKYDPNDKLTRERITLVKDILRGGIIKAETIRGMLSTTRGPSDVVSITFGEGLIPFDYNKSNIKPDAKTQLNEIGKALQSLSCTIEIAGHTDARGSDEYNRNLSGKRAQSVAAYLATNYRIPKEKMKSNGYGKKVPLCTDAAEACHSLNRRVEIIKREHGAGESLRGGATRSAFATPAVAERHSEPKIVVEAGFFYQNKGSKTVKVLTEDVRLISLKDRYFIFFRPLQDCHVYIIQEDENGGISLLFPDKNRGGGARVKKGNDYWVPAPGKAYTLDDTKGEEKLYFLVTSWPLQGEMERLSSKQDARGGVGGRIEGVSLKEQVRGAIRSLKTRAILVVQPEGAPQKETSQHISENELTRQPDKINTLLERIEGEGGWVKMVGFRHE